MLGFKRKYLDDNNLQYLKSYKYIGGGYGIGANACNWYWEIMVKWLPLWMAPNMVTLIGITAMFVALFQYLPYDASFKMVFTPTSMLITSVCSWVY